MAIEKQIIQPGLFLSVSLLHPAVRWEFKRPVNVIGSTHPTCRAQKRFSTSCPCGAGLPWQAHANFSSQASVGGIGEAWRMVSSLPLTHLIARWEVRCHTARPHWCTYRTETLGSSRFNWLLPLSLMTFPLGRQRETHSWKGSFNSSFWATMNVSLLSLGQEAESLALSGPPLSLVPQSHETPFW